MVLTVLAVGGAVLGLVALAGASGVAAAWWVLSESDEDGQPGE